MCQYFKLLPLWKFMEPEYMKKKKKEGCFLLATVGYNTPGQLSSARV